MTLIGCVSVVANDKFKHYSKRQSAKRQFDWETVKTGEPASILSLDPLPRSSPSLKPEQNWTDEEMLAELNPQSRKTKNIL